MAEYTKQRRSEAAKRAWARPDHREKHTAVIKASWESDSRDNRIAGIKEAWKRPEVRREYVAGQIRSWVKRRAKKEATQ